MIIIRNYYFFLPTNNKIIDILINTSMNKIDHRKEITTISRTKIEWTDIEYFISVAKMFL